jgi:steroid 5-alpha reductase family enzyme
MMNESFWSLSMLGLTLAISIMALVWLLARIINNASIVDIAWSLGFTPIVLAFAVFGTGAPERRYLLAAMVCVWSLRLGSYIWVRVAKHHPEEDGRYAELRRLYPKHPWLMFFGFFQLQAILLSVLAVPFVIAAVNPSPQLGPWEWTGAAIWLVAMLGEATADAQLHKFRSHPANKGRTCMVGLWRYSRHPNYFFEWMIWVAYFVFAMGSPTGWLAIVSPAIMLFFLFKVTGIPATEAHALKSRGDEYREYQRTTSVFVPWFSKAPR